MKPTLSARISGDKRWPTNSATAVDARCSTRLPTSSMIAGVASARLVSNANSAESKLNVRMGAGHTVAENAGVQASASTPDSVTVVRIAKAPASASTTDSVTVAGIAKAPAFVSTTECATTVSIVAVQASASTRRFAAVAGSAREEAFVT